MIVSEEQKRTVAHMMYICRLQNSFHHIVHYTHTVVNVPLPPLIAKEISIFANFAICCAVSMVWIALSALGDNKTA